MSSLNKVAINGSHTGSSRQPSRQSCIWSTRNTNVNGIASLQASSRCRSRLSSRGISRSSQRNVEMILKRIVARKKITNKAISDLLAVYPKEIGFDSLQNIITKFKLPLSKDETIMLFENSKAVDQAQSSVAGKTWSNIKVANTGEAVTKDITQSLKASLLGKLNTLIDIFENIKRDPRAYSSHHKKIDQAIKLLNKVNIPFEESNVRKIFNQNTDLTRNLESRGYFQANLNAQNLDVSFNRFKHSLRNHWKELHRSVEVLTVSGKFEYISADLVTKLFSKHYLGVGVSEINDLIAVRSSYLAARGAVESSQNGFDIDLFSKVVSACIDRQWSNVIKALADLTNENKGNRETSKIETDIARSLQKYHVYLSESEVSSILCAPDIAAPLSSSINLDEYNRGKLPTTKIRKSNSMISINSKSNPRLLSQNSRISVGRRMMQRRSFGRRKKMDVLTTQKRVKELWKGIQGEYTDSDGNFSGCLNEKQFVDVILKLGLQIKRHKLKAMFRQFDARSTGQINFDDFLSKFLGARRAIRSVPSRNGIIPKNNAIPRKSKDIGIINRSSSATIIHRPNNVPKLNLKLARVQSESNLDYLEEWGDNSDVMALCD